MVVGGGKPEERSVTMRPMKELFIFVPWTQNEREKEFFPNPLSARRAKLGSHRTRQCCSSLTMGRERVKSISALSIPAETLHMYTRGRSIYLSLMHAVPLKRLF